MEAAKLLCGCTIAKAPSSAAEAFKLEMLPEISYK